MEETKGCLDRVKHAFSCCTSKKHKGVIKAVCDCCQGSHTLVIAYDEKSDDGSSTDIEIDDDTIKVS